MSARKYRGPSKFTAHSTTLSYTSWFADPYRVYADSLAMCENELRGQEGGKVMVTAFNRI